MPKKPLMNLSNSFRPAVSAKTGTERIAELQVEIERLKAENKKLSSSDQQELATLLEQEQGSLLLPLEEIEPNPTQARKTFPEEAIRKKAASLLKNGQFTPIIVIPSKEGKKYRIEDGEERWRAAQLLVNEGHSQWKKIRVVLSLAPESDLDRRSLLHNLHVDDLNALDRIEAIFAQIYHPVEISEKSLDRANGDEKIARELELAAVIRNIDYRIKRSSESTKALVQQLPNTFGDEQQEILTLISSTLELSDLQKYLLELFADLQITISTVVANDLSALFLPEDLKKAIRNGLPCRQAFQMQKLTPTKLGISEEEAEKLRQELVQKTLDEELGYREVSRLVNEQLENSSPKTPSQSDLINAFEEGLPQRLKKVSSKLKKPKRSWSPEEQQEILNLISRLEELAY